MSVVHRLNCELLPAFIIIALTLFGFPSASHADSLLELSIANRTNIIPGDTVGLNIFPIGNEIQVSEFELRIAFDASVLSVADVLPGPFYESNGWEYFDYRVLPSDESRPDSLSGIVRIRAVADLADYDATPSSLILPNARPMVSIIFNTIEDPALAGRLYPIRFYWTGCGDNILYSGDSDTVFVSNLVTDYIGGQYITDNTLLPTIHGAPDACLIGDNPDWGKTVTRAVDFRNGYIAFGPDTLVEPFEFVIEMKGPWEVGIPCDIGVSKTKGTELLRGFDFLISFNMSEITFLGAEANELTQTDGPYQWEYFTYRYEINNDCIADCPTGLIRIIALGETNNGAHHPLSLSIPDGMELFTMQFRPIDVGVYATIDFYWMDCSDNAVAFSYRNNSEQILTGLSEKVFSFIDYGPDPYQEITDPLAQFPTYFGAPSVCFEMADPFQPLPIPLIRFYNGGIDIVSLDVDIIGDVNLNGIKYEIADFILFAHQLTRCNYDLFTVIVEGQKAASDVNRDGIPMTIEDLVYMARIIIGDALPGPTDSSYPGQILINEFPDEIDIHGTFANDVGGMHLMYLLDSTTTILNVEGWPSLQEMTLDYNICFDTLKILIYDLGNESISAGEYTDLLRIHYAGKVPNLISITAAAYDGHKFDLYIEEPFQINIKTAMDQLQGHTTSIDVIKEKGSGWIYGFDFLIGFDQGALTLDGVTAGELFDEQGDYQWEYFTYRYNENGDCGPGCPSGLLRVVGLAETNDGEHYPLSRDIPDGMTLFNMDFTITSDYQLAGTFVPIDFFWTDCGDNVMSFEKYGYYAGYPNCLALSRKVHRYDGTEHSEISDIMTGFPTYTGTQVECLEEFNLEAPMPIPIVDYYGGGIGIIIPDEIDARCDLNLNGVIGDTTDCRIFRDRLLERDDHPEFADCSDFNGDGIPMTIEDYVYFARYGEGNALPLDMIDSTFQGVVTFYEEPELIIMTTDFDLPVGGMILKYYIGNATISDVMYLKGHINMTLDYHCVDDTLRIVIYNWAAGCKIPAGSEVVMGLKYFGEIPQFVSVSAAGYYGRKVELQTNFEGAYPARIGDLNLDGGINILDVTKFIEYFIWGGSVFNIKETKQKVASDINWDGIQLTPADMVLLIRIIYLEADFGPQPVSPFNGTAFITRESSNININFEFENYCAITQLVFYAPGLTYCKVSGREAHILNDTLRVGCGVRLNDPGVLKDSLLITFEGPIPQLLSCQAAGENAEVINMTVVYLDPADVAESEIEVIPRHFALKQNYPNPFNMSTQIKFDLPKQAEWNLDIYNIAGRKVRSFDGTDEAGTYRVSWDGRDDNGIEVGSGIYLYRIKAGEFVDSKKMIMLK